MAVWNDNVVVLERNLAQLSDTVPISDSVAAIETLRFAGISDAVSLSDQVLMLEVSRAAIDEFLSLSDQTTARLTLLANLSDSFGSTLADLVVYSLIISGGAVPINASMSDALNLQDNAVALERLLALASETIDLSDIVSALERSLASIGDSVGMADQVILIEALLAVFSDSVALSDLVQRMAPLLAQPEDAMDYSDTVAALERLRASFGDTLTLEDSVTYGLTFLGGLPGVGSKSIRWGKFFYSLGKRQIGPT